MAYEYPEPTGDRMMPMASLQAEALETTLPDSFVKSAEKKIAKYGAGKMQPKAPAYAPMSSRMEGGEDYSMVEPNLDDLSDLG